MDRRFNRARYDADQAVAAFAARLKDAVDQDTVRKDLARVVQVALEPAHVSVWTSLDGWSNPARLASPVEPDSGPGGGGQVGPPELSGPARSQLPKSF